MDCLYHQLHSMGKNFRHYFVQNCTAGNRYEILWIDSWKTDQLFLKKSALKTTIPGSFESSMEKRALSSSSRVIGLIRALRDSLLSTFPALMVAIPNIPFCYYARLMFCLIHKCHYSDAGNSCVCFDETSFLFGNCLGSCWPYSEVLCSAVRHFLCYLFISFICILNFMSELLVPASCM